MYENAIKILQILNDKGFSAYIVGGYPRDKYLGIDSNDIDICTNARPNDIRSVFSDVDMTNASYGSVRLSYEDYKYEITTFRKDNAMLNGERSYSVEFVGSLEEDLIRRDFIMNTLCIDKDGNYVDYLGAINDIDKKIIRTVKDPSISFSEDPLRILRAIRFSTTLSFSLSEELIISLYNMNQYLSKLSYYYRKKELDLIFSNENCMFGISSLKKYGLEQFLSLNFNNITYCSNYLGIWTQCIVDFSYPFTKEEKLMIDKIDSVMRSTPSFMVLYEYGIDICLIVDEINGNDIYYELNKKIPIHNRDEINIDKEFLLSNVHHNLISNIYKKLEQEILLGRLLNEEAQIKGYILKYIL